MSAPGTQSYQLSDYLEKLPGTTFRRLYQQPSTAFAIFRRMLPHLAKTFVMALVYMPEPLRLSELEVWVKDGYKKDRDRAVSLLRLYHIATVTPPSKEKPPEISLTTNFKNSLRLALEGGGNHNSFGAPSTLPVDASIDIPFLDRYARKKWDDILHFVVDSVAESKYEIGSTGPKASVKDLLLAGRLVERKNKVGPLSITQAGFTFLLQEANAQVWTLLLLWLEAASVAGSPMDSVDMLSFLFMLASLELGRAYDTDALTEPRRNMLPSLVDFGLIYIPRDTPRQYFPTRLATTLTSNASALRSVSAGFEAATNPNAEADATGLGEPQDAKGAIIIETNYRLYAYTNSPLQIAVIALFAKMELRFAGMVTARITRASIRKAVSHGITADQIIAYLAAHAHEQMARAAAAANKPVLPPTVVDQIRLWQMESERMTTTSGFLFKDFESEAEYEALVGYADEIGVLTWRSDVKKMFFASKHEQLRDYLKSRKKIEA
ncbi:RNA polymerase II transcription factor B subunit 2-like protein [Coniochaeta sp. 2T2.1]|nr:RNA polymerase II transcription factor B subunit 2-like protein [Coniochaeta sp. 2T2.1]